MRMPLSGMARGGLGCRFEDAAVWVADLRKNAGLATIKVSAEYGPYFSNWAQSLDVLKLVVGGAVELLIGSTVDKIVTQGNQLVGIDQVYTAAHQKVPDGRIIGRAPEPDFGADGMGAFDEALQPVLFDG